MLTGGEERIEKRSEKIEAELEPKIEARARALEQHAQSLCTQVLALDRLQSALGELAGRGFVVLHGCADHWAARDALRERPGAAGAIWFTAADVWHAVDEPMLELNVWHADTANAAPGDPVLDEVLSVLAAHSLPAHFDEGRVEIAIRWERRPV